MTDSTARKVTQLGSFICIAGVIMMATGYPTGILLLIGGFLAAIVGRIFSK